jgi:glycerol-3-phosphate acyltransferase PlsY
VSEAGVLIVAAGYLAGSLPFGYWIARRAGHDVRATGSGNIGATNVARVLGRGAGLATFALDAIKGAIAPAAGFLAGAPIGWCAAAAVAAVVGHCWPVFLGFRGGKGVATLVGAFTALDPVATSASGLVFATGLGLWRMVSVASLGLAASLIVFEGLRHGWGDARTTAAAAGCLLVAVRHRANLGRVARGTEPRLGRRSETTEARHD